MKTEENKNKIRAQLNKVKTRQVVIGPREFTQELCMPLSQHMVMSLVPSVTVLLNIILMALLPMIPGTMSIVQVPH